MSKFVKKPVVVDAVQFTFANVAEVEEFLDCPHTFYPETYTIRLSTLEGIMTASLGDWIIKGVNGEFYPCKPDIFNKTYDPYPETEGSAE